LKTPFERMWPKTIIFLFFALLYSSFFVGLFLIFIIF
jgi:hypothetical protein